MTEAETIALLLVKSMDDQCYADEKTLILKRWSDEKEKLNLESLTEALLQLKHIKKDAEICRPAIPVFNVETSGNHHAKASSTTGRRCKRCKRDHDENECRHKTSKCYKCQRIGHIAKACRRSRSTSSSSDTSRKEISTKYKSYNIRTSGKNMKEVMVKINGKRLRCGLDTGSEINIIRSKDVKRLNLKINPTKTEATWINGSTTKFMGKSKVSIGYGTRILVDNAYIHKHAQKNIIGMQAIEALQMIKMVDENQVQRRKGYIKPVRNGDRKTKAKTKEERRERTRRVVFRTDQVVLVKDKDGKWFDGLVIKRVNGHLYQVMKKNGWTVVVHERDMMVNELANQMFKMNGLKPNLFPIHGRGQPAGANPAKKYKQNKSRDQVK